MRELLDDLFTGTVSRRKFMKRATAAGLALPLLSGALAIDAQDKSQDKKPPKPKPTGPQEENPVYSPANIGGGGRIERNFYRDWTRHTNVPKIDDPYSVYDVVTQEVKPWPEIGGSGPHLQLHRHTHTGGGIYQIPQSQSLVPRQQFSQQGLIAGQRGRDQTLAARPRKAK